MSASESISPLYIRTGVNFATSEVSKLTPQIRAKGYARRQEVETAFGRTPLIATVDGRLSDRGLRVLSLLAVRALKTRRIAVSFDEVAFAIGCSRSTAIRSLGELQELGYIRADKRHNCRNVYELLSPVFADLDGEDSAEPPQILTQCVKCGRVASTNRIGKCNRCLAVERERRRARAILSRDPGANDEAVYVRIRTLGAKTMRKIIADVRAELAAEAISSGVA